jgi:hypothetical protein
MEGKWAGSAFAVRVNLPFTFCGRIIRESALLERRLLELARAKRGKADARDVVSIIVNNPDADRNPPSDATLGSGLNSITSRRPGPQRGTRLKNSFRASLS